MVSVSGTITVFTKISVSALVIVTVTVTASPRPTTTVWYFVIVTVMCPACSWVSIVAVLVTAEGSVSHVGVVIRIVVVSVGVGPMKVVVVPGTVVAAVRVMMTLLVIEELVILVSGGVRYVTPTARPTAAKTAITAPVAICLLYSDKPLSHLRRGKGLYGSMLQDCIRSCVLILVQLRSRLRVVKQEVLSRGRGLVRADDMDGGSDEFVLKDTTLRVYRFLYREGRPVGIRDVQRGLGLSSPSVAQYHVRKLLEAGLVREQNSGYVVDRPVFENMIRVRRALIPFQTTYSIFFASALILMLTVLRPPSMTSSYVFGLIAIAVALATSIYEAVKSLKGIY